jgi:hypothetical protein
VAANSFLCVIEAKWASGIVPYSLELLKPIAAATLALASGFLLKSAFADGSPLLLVPLVGAIYVGVLMAIGLNDGDRRAFARLYSGIAPRLRFMTGGREGDR